MATMMFPALVASGIDIISIDDDFKGCQAVLTTSRNEWVNVAVRLSNDYPYRSPEVAFKGGLRPRRFVKREIIFIDEFYDYAFCAVEDTLRALLLDMETEGVCTVGMEKPVFV